MSEEITLRFSSSCFAQFNFGDVTRDRRSVKTSVELFLPRDSKSNIRSSQERLIHLEDLSRLCAYLEKHISDQQVAYPEESYTFTTYELLFSIQALTGTVKSNTEGSFSINFMINIGLDPGAGNRLFAGIQTSIQVVDVNDFILNLRSLLSKIERDTLWDE